MLCRCPPLVRASDLLILDFEQRKSHLKKLGQKLEEMKNKHHLLLLEQVRGKCNPVVPVEPLPWYQLCRVQRLVARCQRCVST